MKKLLYVAVMALTMGFFASCNNGPSTGMKYAEGENPTINVVDGTVNGQAYDMTTAKCWKWTLAESIPGAGSADAVGYDWATEFNMVASLEQSVALANHNGIYAGYSYKEVEASDSEACNNKNEED